MGQIRGVGENASSFQRVSIWFIAVLLRILAWCYCRDFLSKRVELVVPQNSFRRLADGVYMHRNGISPYAGDMFHCQPLILYIFAPIIDQHRILLAFFTVLDIVIAELLRAAALHYMKKKEQLDYKEMKYISNLVVKCYLLNPIAVGSCAIFSLSVLYNFLTALFIYTFVKGSMVFSAVLCSLLTQLNLYPVIFFCAFFVKYKTIFERALVTVLFLFSFSAFIGINYCLNGSFSFLDSTYMFLLDVRDLTPNIGIFWYFFIEVFNHFRLFFLWVFQINILVYVFPLLLTIRLVYVFITYVKKLRDDSFLLLHLYLILVSVFSSYPSMAESLLYLSLIPAFFSLRKYIRWGLLISGTLVTCTVLASIMWLMWIVIGSGNANFYFAVTLAYSVAQIFLLTDLLYAYLHKKVTKERGEEVVKNCACFVLK